jgi:polyhydroxyalkanoate synthesis regulator phasin
VFFYTNVLDNYKRIAQNWFFGLSANYGFILENIIVEGQKNTPLKEIVDSLMADGEVTEAEATELIETLSDGGVLSGAEEDLILDALSADGEITQDEVNNLSETLSGDGKFTEAEKELVADAIIAQFDGAPVTASAIAEAGIDYENLPPETPVETRVDESGEPIVITAEVAEALELVENPSELVGAIFTDPAKALMAIGNIGADMSNTERQESQTVVVASVIVGAIASLSIRRM